MAKSTATVLLATIVLSVLFDFLLCFPHPNSSKGGSQIQPGSLATKPNDATNGRPSPLKLQRDYSKKDIFVSRGWGAGGMPFSVLYMNPTYSSPKASSTIETNNSQKVSKTTPKKLPYKSEPPTTFQVRTSMPSRPKGGNRIPHSVIPQLFVSYGWGPMGRK